MTDSTDGHCHPLDAPAPVPGVDGPVEHTAESPAATFRRVRMLRQDGYRPRRSEAGPPRHLRLVD
jgi:hypothetical protein